MQEHNARAIESSGARIWPGRVMLLLLRDYASPDYAKWTILERDYATYYASVIRDATRAPSHFLGGLC